MNEKKKKTSQNQHFWRSGQALMHSILHQNHSTRVASCQSRADTAWYFGQNCTSGGFWPKPDTSHQSSNTLEAALKVAGARERRSNIHFTLPLHTLTDAVCFDLSLANPLLSEGLCPESRLELAASPMPNGTARSSRAFSVHPTRGGKGYWNSFKPTAPVGEIARLESICGRHK